MNTILPYSYKILCWALFLLLPASAIAQGDASGGKTMTAGMPDESKLLEMKQQAAAFIQSAEWDKGITLTKDIAKYYTDLRQVDSAITYMKKALKIAQLHLPAKMPQMYADMAVCYARFEKQVTSVDYVIKAIKEADRQHTSGRELGDLYNNASMAYMLVRKYDSGIAYSKRAITALEQTKDTSLILESYFNLCLSLPMMGYAQDALQLMDEATRKYPSTNPEYLFAIPYVYTNIYLKIKNYTKAGYYFNKLLQLDITIREAPQNKEMFLYTAARYYTSSGQYALARPYLLARDEMIRKNFRVVDKAKNEQMMFLTDSATGNYPSAIQHLEQYTFWKDSIFNLSKEKQLSELQVAYNSEKKDKDITLLQQREQLKDATIRNQAITRNVSIAGTVLLLLLLIIIYNRYQLKQRTNKELELKQEEINQQNELLKKLLNEKEWLLKEIHHRVKNNLQIVISLLNTQSAFLENEDAIQAIQNSQHRMHAMSLIHQKLYQTDNLALIDMQWYVRELVTYMRECFESAGGITFNLETEPLELDVAQAVPLGLILNEAISNAIKYAFPAGKDGQVTIELKWQSEKLCRLRIADNGVGTPKGFNIEETESLGMSLMRGLSEQLDASFEVQNCSGMIVSVIFPVTVKGGIEAIEKKESK